MFQGLLGISEYLYRLRDLALMYDGKVPPMVQERANWPKKIGRNDRCPCGSGKNINFVMVNLKNKVETMAIKAETVLLWLTLEICDMELRFSEGSIREIP